MIGVVSLKWRKGNILMAFIILLNNQLLNAESQNMRSHFSLLNFNWLRTLLEKTLILLIVLSFDLAKIVLNLKE